jgi:glutathione S-transferase
LLDILDAQLARQPFLAGPHLSMADIPIACELHRWRGLPLPQARRPYLDRWYDGMLSLPASRGALDVPLS